MSDFFFCRLWTKKCVGYILFLQIIIKIPIEIGYYFLVCSHIILF